LAYTCGRTCISSPDYGLHTENILPAYKDLSTLLFEVFGLGRVAVNSLSEVTSKALYMELTSTLPLPQG
jgi:hypothetical protein